MRISRLARYGRPRVYDVLISGGGATGMALATAISATPLTSHLRVGVIDPAPGGTSSKVDGDEKTANGFNNSNNLIGSHLSQAAASDAAHPRVSSLSPAAVSILDAVGAWPSICASGRHAGVANMAVWDAASPPWGRATREAHDNSLGGRPRARTYGDSLARLGSAVAGALKGGPKPEITFSAESVSENYLAHVVENDIVVAALRDAASELPNPPELIWNTYFKGVDTHVNSPDVSHADVQVEQIIPGAAEDGKPTKKKRTLHTKLLIGAEGAFSPTRTALGIQFTTAGYAQNGVVATVELARESDTAWQAFMGRSGPLALLPLFTRTSDGAPRGSIVWACDPRTAKELVAADDALFLDAANAVMSTRLGPAAPEMVSVEGPRLQFPFRTGNAGRYITHRGALIGDAGHCVHPLAGQGLNLGFGDVAAMMTSLSTAVRAGVDIGTLPSLEMYERRQMPRNLATLAVNHGIQRTFTSRWGPLAVARGLAMGGFDGLEPIKDVMIRGAMGADIDLRDVGKFQVA